MGRTRQQKKKNSALLHKIGQSRCCNPFGRNNHIGKGLRPVSKFFRRLHPQFAKGTLICTDCRLTPGNATERNEDMEEVEVFALEANVVRNLKKKETRTREQDLEEMFQAFKNKFSSLDRRNPLRTQILTCCPKDWSINKITKEFGCSKREARKAKKLREEEGCWPEMTNKLRSRIPQESQDLAVNFFNDDRISKILPGKKDVVSMVINDERQRIQKRLILFELKKVYDEFLIEHPTAMMSFSYFCNLRPKNVVLPGASGTHIVCVCTIHQNIILMIEAISSILKKNESDNLPANHRDFIKMITCKTPNRDCHLNECANCPRSSVVSDFLIELFTKEAINEIEYPNWISVDRTTMLNVTATPDEFVEQFVERLTKLKVHSFITKEQSAYSKYLKENLADGEVLNMFDFSQNFAYIAQDAAQAFYYNNNQCTVFPYIFYYRKDGVIQHQCCIFLSDCIKHDSAFVYAAMTLIMPKIKAVVKKVRKMIYFTDGAKQHFKNRFQIDLLRHHKEDFGCEAEWHFNTTAHGRSEYDGLGATFKTKAYKASLKANAKDALLTFDNLVQWAEANFENIWIFHFTKAYHETITKRLNRRYKNAPAVYGISQNHSFSMDKNHNLVMKKFSTDKKSITLDN